MEIARDTSRPGGMGVDEDDLTSRRCMLDGER